MYYAHWKMFFIFSFIFLGEIEEKNPSLLSYSRSLTWDELMGIEGAQQEVFQRAVCVSGAKEKAAPPPVAAVTARSLRPFKLPSALRSLDYGFCASMLLAWPYITGV